MLILDCGMWISDLLLIPQSAIVRLSAHDEVQNPK
jgi:hypothetical protein